MEYSSAEGLTLGVAPAVPRLPSKYNHGLAGAALSAGTSVSKPFAATAPEIQELIMSMFKVYTDRDGTALTSLLTKAFDPQAVFDLPAFFVDSSSSMATLAHLLFIPFWKVTAHPKLVTVKMLTPSLGRIDVEATLEFHPRFASLFPAALVVPEHLQLHGTWTIAAKGDDDKILSVTETLHNLPSLPLFLRRLIATGMVTAGSILGF